MERTEPAVFTNMCMVYDGDKLLVQNRTDPNWSGIVFPGGHVEPEESFVASAIREVKEETGLDISNLQLCGVKQFPRPDKSFRYVVFLFKTCTFKGELKSSKEGEVFWIDKKDIDNYTLARGFRTMYDVFMNDDLSENYIWFDGGWHYEKF